jgi:hypothetical protein
VFLFALHLLVSPAAAAQISLDDPAVTAAEVDRLREELGQLARRNVWVGVDRTYREMEALAPDRLVANDHFVAAQAAAATGDTWLVTTRLRAALATGEDVAGVREWLTEIARRYGRVQLTGDHLEAVRPPFAPDEAEAVRHAAATLEAEHHFDGLLPVGKYRVGDEIVVVKASRQR